MNIITVTAVLAVSVLISFSECSPSRKLIQYLETTYKKSGLNGLPSTNSSEPLEISVSFALVQILGFDQLHQVISLVGTLSTRWRDDILVWNPSDYDNTDYIQIPASSVWTPDIVLFNAVDRPVPTHDSLLKVTSDGDVTWVTKRKYKMSCATSPDERKPSCGLKFGSWSMDVNTVKLIAQAHIIDAGYYLPDHEWELSTTDATVSTKTYPCCPGEEYSDITFTFKLIKREEEEKIDLDKLCNSAKTMNVDIIMLLTSSLLMLFKLL